MVLITETRVKPLHATLQIFKLEIAKLLFNWNCYKSPSTSICKSTSNFQKTTIQTSNENIVYIPRYQSSRLQQCIK